VVIARSSDQPIIAAELDILGGAQTDPPSLAGANAMVADLVTEGTTSRTEPQVAGQIESLGGELSSGSGWETSQVSLGVLASEAAPALAIMADVAEHPIFDQVDLDRVRKESLDALAVEMRQSADIARFVTSPVIFAGTPFGHVARGSAGSLARLDRDDLLRLHQIWWRPDNAVLVLSGNLTPDQGFALASAAFGGWARPAGPPPALPVVTPDAPPRSLAVDLPGAAQVEVVVAKPVIARADQRYYAGLVANAVLGGGYSARLNEEIRIKRGLSYGAGSSLDARATTGAFSAQAQTKNESAPQVVKLIRAQVEGLAAAPASAEELEARKSSLVGEYGRSLGAADGLAAVLGELLIHGVAPGELDTYTQKVGAVTAAEVQAFARDVLIPGGASVIVVGDAKVFAAPLRAALPDLQIIPLSRLDLDRTSLGSPTAY
jgi:zinc protease